MSNVIYSINLSADGCCDHTAFNGSDGMVDYATEQFQGIDLIVWGRKTYELMIPYWIDVARDLSGTPSENAFATKLAAIPKVIFSKTLESAEGNDHINRGDLKTEFLKLKEKYKNISTGGVSLPSQLAALGLVDEFRFLVHPTIVGDGRRLLEPGKQANLGVQLKETKVLPSGAVALHYAKR